MVAQVVLAVVRSYTSNNSSSQYNGYSYVWMTSPDSGGTMNRQKAGWNGSYVRGSVILMQTPLTTVTIGIYTYSRQVMCRLITSQKRPFIIITLTVHTHRQPIQVAVLVGGGVGAGYNQSAASGSSGASGGTNAGAGGTGGTGGDFGSSGSTGGTGTNGNSSNGSSGSSGGAAGNYIRGISLVSLTQSGINSRGYSVMQYTVEEINNNVAKIQFSDGSWTFLELNADMTEADLDDIVFNIAPPHLKIGSGTIIFKCWTNKNSSSKTNRRSRRGW